MRELGKLYITMKQPTSQKDNQHRRMTTDNAEEEQPLIDDEVCQSNEPADAIGSTSNFPTWWRALKI